MDATTSTLVVLEVYDNPTQAGNAKSILDSAGIFCVLTDEYISTIYTPFAFPIRLMVPDNLVDEAKALLTTENY